MLNPSYKPRAAISPIILLHAIMTASAIQELLIQLSEADPKRRMFGADTHRYQLNVPVSEATLSRAESAIGAPLPAEYRTFITSAGDGGAGPYYGVIPLGGALDRLEDHLDSLLPLGRDCPLTADLDFGEIACQPDDWEEHVARLGSDPTYAARFDDLPSTYNSDPWLDGRLPVVDYGCGDWFFLVVRGPRRGTLWVDSTSNGSGLYCLNVDFLTFYRRWLDDALEAATRGRYWPDPAYYSFLRYGNNPRFRP
jgi:hypothetical protein